MTDDPGLLGNLPRSRPGTRSDKRATGSAAKPKPAKPKPAKSEPVGAKTGPKGPTPKTRPKISNPKPRPAPQPSPGDPVTETLKVAARIAGAGASTVNGVTRGILRRLPRL